MDIQVEASIASPLAPSDQNNNKKVQQFNDGSVIEIHTDGTIVQKTSNGLVLETRPDGTRIQTMPDGKRLEIHPNGKVRTIQPIAPPRTTAIAAVEKAGGNDLSGSHEGSSHAGEAVSTSKIFSAEIEDKSDENQENKLNKSNLSSLAIVSDVKDQSKYSSPRKPLALDTSKINESSIVDLNKSKVSESKLQQQDAALTPKKLRVQDTQQSVLAEKSVLDTQDQNSLEVPSSPPVFSDNYIVPSTPISQVDNDAQINEAEHYYSQFVTATRLLMKEKRTREKEAKEAMNKIHQLDKQRLQAEEKMKKAQRELTSAVAQVEAKYQAQIKSLQSHMKTVSMAAQAQSTKSAKGSALSMLNSSSFFNFGKSFRNRSSLNIGKTASTSSALHSSSGSEIEALTQRIHELEHELSEQYTLSATAKENSNTYLEAAVQSEAMLASLQTEVSDLKFQLAKTEKKAKSLKTEKQQLETQIEDLIFKGGSVAEELQKAQDCLKQEREKVEKLTEEIEVYRQNGNGQIVNQAQEIFALQREIRELKQKQASNRLSLVSSNSSAPLTVTQQIAHLQEQLSNSQSEKTELKSQLDASRKRALEAENQFKRLRGENVNSVQSNQGPKYISNSSAPPPPPLPSEPLTQMPMKRMSRQFANIQLNEESGNGSNKRASISLNNPEHCSAIAELVKLKALQRKARMSKLDNLLTGQTKSAARPSIGGKQGGPLTLQQMFSSAMALRRPNIAEDSESEEEEEEDEFNTSENNIVHIQSTSKPSAQKTNPPAPASSTKKPKVRGPMVNDLNDSTAWW